MEHAPLAYCSWMRDLQVHAFVFSCQSVYKLSPTSLSAFDRTDITTPCTTPRRYQGQDGEVGRSSPTCRLWRRDNDEEDGDGTRGQHVHRRRKYVGYTTRLLFIFVVISLLSPTCWLWRRDSDEVDGGDDDQRGERTTSPKNVCWLYYLSVVFWWLLSLWSPTCWLWQRDNDGGWWWQQRDERTTLPKKVRWLYYLSVGLF